ncbi:UNVERIFIED_CONTAM: hypothetical protein PYX00_006139 [Menopon gallinae]|uniref:palmitoyl-CoA hydrolase n=1 Tax=Menopon gallinae TaxID=328185 RepID=A0AAW2HU65_9NEOP
MEMLIMHKGTEVYISNRFDGWASLEPMWVQTKKFGADLLNISRQYPDGIHLIGYSQGGLIARAILEKYPEHNVHTFISLSSPQAGQYGTQFLKVVFPNLVRASAYKLFYSVAGQLTSVGNYWNDPHQQELYYNYSAFLPLLNNELSEKRNDTFKDGLLKLKRMVLIGGPDDGVITPWQSSLFGYFDSDENIVDLRKRDIYANDYIGLKKLEKEKKLIMITASGVHHFFWRKNVSVIDNYILPYLD